ncbi:MAG TPA: hypothetical protein VGY51_05890 [Acidimicrobiales bacterium]|jgi:hypothetical protein|nr:hypothetical protein [Acidimicrobiales bacterium]
MTKFLYSYRMAVNYQPGRPQAVEAWRAFFESLGANLVDPGNPVFESGALGITGNGSVRLGGYSLLTADDLDAAVAMAKGCPALGEGGGVEVGVLTEVYRDGRLTAPA